MTFLCEHEFAGRITYGGLSYLKMVNEKFTVLGVLDWVTETPFAQFFERTTLNFSPVLLHSLLLRKIDPTKRWRIISGWKINV